MALMSWKRILRSPCKAIRRLHGMHTDRSSSLRSSLNFNAPTEAAMGALASLLASELRPGDCYCLYGDVGAGKSVFSRAFIRAAADDPDLPVPSPTYLLMNAYDEHGDPPVHHFDLYRLTSSPTDERALQRLDLRSSTSTAVCLIEWADRLQSQRPDDHLAVHIAIAPSSYIEDSRDASVAPVGGVLLDDGAGELEEGRIFSDQRSRRVTLTPHGSVWGRRLRSLADSLPSTLEGGLEVIGNL